MINETHRVTGAKAVAVALAIALAASALVFSTTGSAGADPQQLTALVGAGSDTTQDIMNALSGYANGKNYTPVQGGPAKQQVISFDATNPSTGGDNCIAPKVKASTIYRSNGSTQGRRALSRAIDLTNYGPAAQCGGSKPVNGLIDFARSSSGPASGDTGTDLTYIPFGRDGVSFAFYANGVATPVTTLTRAQLTSLFTTGPQTIGGVQIVPCGIQDGSGTYGFWNTVTTATTAQEAAATATCNAATSTPTGDGRIQENAADQLKAKGDSATLVGKQVIVGFSAANFISQSNGVAASQLASGVDLGSISDNGSGTNLGKPYSGTAPALTPNATFYSDSVFGRNVYNVLDSARLSASGSLGLKFLFVSTGATSTVPGVPANTTAVICQSTAQAIVNQFGFLTTSACGSTSTKGSLISGIQ